jgi:hypothetical protein
VPKPSPRGEHSYMEEPTISDLGVESLSPYKPPITDLLVPLLIQLSPPRVTHHEHQIVLQASMEENASTSSGSPHTPSMCYTEPSQPTGQKSTHTGSFLLHWPEELSTMALLFPFREIYTHKQPCEIYPLYTLRDRTLRFHEFGGQASCLSDPRNPKLYRSAFSLSVAPFSLSRFSEVTMSSNLSPRFPKPELPKLRCACKVYFSTTLHSTGISDFAIS